LKLSSNTNYSENDLYQKAINEKWVGNGTSENPFIIENTHSLPDHSIIKSSSLHILIKNCTFKMISFKSCKNIKFEGCSFEYAALSKCSRINLGNCSFKETLELRYSHNLCIQDSHIPFLIFSMCYENHFKTCTITRIFNAFSRANIFENIDAPEDYNTFVGGGLNTLVRGGTKKYFTRLLGFIAAGTLSLISAIIIFINDYSNSIIWSLIGGLVLMAFILFIVPLALYLDNRKMQHYPDNQIIKRSSEV